MGTQEYAKIISKNLKEIAYKNGWTSLEELTAAAERYGKSPYGEHLRAVAEGKIRY